MESFLKVIKRKNSKIWFEIKSEFTGKMYNFWIKAHTLVCLSPDGAALSFWLRSALVSRSSSSGLWAPTAACCSTPSALTRHLGSQRHKPQTRCGENSIFNKDGSNSPHWFLSCGSLRPKTSTAFLQFSVSVQVKKKKGNWANFQQDTEAWQEVSFWL